MNNTIDTNALSNALDAAAPDAESWLKGEAAYNAQIELDPSDIKSACFAALNAAAPDEKEWFAGRNIFVLHGINLLPEAPKQGLKERIRRLHEEGSSKARFNEAREHVGKRTENGGWMVIVGMVIGLIIAIIVYPLYSDAVHTSDMWRGLRETTFLALLLMLFFGAAFGSVAGFLIKKRVYGTTPTE